MIAIYRTVIINCPEVLVICPSTDKKRITHNWNFVNMQLSNVRRIVIEDFKKEDRAVVEKLAVILNPFMDDVVTLTQGNIDYDNLARSKVTVDLTVDATGTVIGVTQINTQLQSYSGNKIINVQSLVGSSNVISAPYLDCTYQGNGIVKINKMYGLVVGKKTRVTFEFIA